MRLVKNYVHISYVAMSAYVFPSALRSMGRNKAPAVRVRVAPEMPKRDAYKEFTRKTGNTEKRLKLNCAAGGLFEHSLHSRKLATTRGQLSFSQSTAVRPSVRPSHLSKRMCTKC